MILFEMIYNYETMHSKKDLYKNRLYKNTYMIINKIAVSKVISY